MQRAGLNLLKQGVGPLRTGGILLSASTAILFSSALAASGHYGVAALAAATILAIGFVLSLHISLETLLVTWFATSPLASFFIRFPLERSVLTYDRLVFILAAVWIAFQIIRTQAGENSREGVIRSHFLVSKFEIAWLLLCGLALYNAALRSEDAAAAGKLAVDSFCLPLIAFHAVRYHFDPRRRGSVLFASATFLVLVMFATGAFEILTGVNIFPYKGSELIRDGEIRVNGPFQSDSSYAIIGLTLAVFLMQAPRILRVRLDAASRLLWICALTAAVGAALLPLFRAVAASLVVCMAIIGFSVTTTKRRVRKLKDQGSPGEILGAKKRVRLGWFARSTITALVTVVLVLAFVVLGGSPIRERLGSPRSAFGRAATWESALRIAMDRPVLGVGLGNYTKEFRDRYYGRQERRESVLRVRAADTPHSNALWILAELGLVGLALYLIANFYLLLMGYRALVRSTEWRQKIAAVCYLALLAAYWIPGLTLTSGAYSDLNLYLFFMLGLLLNISRSVFPAGIGALPVESAGRSGGR